MELLRAGRNEGSHRYSQSEIPGFRANHPQPLLQRAGGEQSRAGEGVFRSFVGAVSGKQRGTTSRCHPVKSEQRWGAKDRTALAVLTRLNILWTSACLDTMI